MAGSFLTTWFDYRSGSGTQQARATRVSPSGVVDAAPAVAAAAGTNVSGQPVLVVAASTPASARALRALDGDVDLREDPPSVGEKDLTGGKELHPARRPLEEACSELVLEREDVSRKGRLREVKLAGSATDVALFRDRDEGLDVRETHERNGT